MDKRARIEVALYSTDELRRMYQSEIDEPIRLRDSLLSRAELTAEILRRVRSERWIGRVTLLAAVVGAAAAVEGWH